MALTQLMKSIYKLKGKWSEGEMVAALRTARGDLAIVDPSFIHRTLSQTLEVVERGSYEIERNFAGAGITVDLSQINSLVQQYRALSEGGCGSCTHFATCNLSDDESGHYCMIRETEAHVDKASGWSPITAKYQVTGCNSKIPIFKPLPKLLAEHKGE